MWALQMPLEWPCPERSLVYKTVETIEEKTFPVPQLRKEVTEVQLKAKARNQSEPCEIKNAFQGFQRTREYGHLFHGNKGRFVASEQP